MHGALVGGGLSGHRQVSHLFVPLADVLTTALGRLAILFLQPHPTNAAATSLFLQYTDLDGLERAVRLFPIRTGVLSPDWIVVNGRADKFGAAGVEGAGYVYFSSVDKILSTSC